MNRYGGQLLASHEYSTAQFFVVFIAIVLGAQSSGQFLAHSLGKFYFYFLFSSP